MLLQKFYACYQKSYSDLLYLFEFSYYFLDFLQLLF